MPNLQQPRDPPLDAITLTMVSHLVPAQICDSCGADYIDEPAIQRILIATESAARLGATIEVVEVAAA